MVVNMSLRQTKIGKKMTRRAVPQNQFQVEPYKTAQKMMDVMAAEYTRPYRKSRKQMTQRTKPGKMVARGSKSPAGEPMPNFGFSHDDAEWLGGDQWTQEEIEEFERKANDRDEIYRVNHIKTTGR